MSGIKSLGFEVNDGVIVIFQSPLILTIQVKIIPLTVSVSVSPLFPVQYMLGVVSVVKYGDVVSPPILRRDGKSGAEVSIVKEAYREGAFG